MNYSQRTLYIPAMDVVSAVKYGYYENILVKNHFLSLHSFLSLFFPLLFFRFIFQGCLPART